MAGPLQTFAYELRKVRAEAGNPTYRALAKAAGYSATTLSEAASGMRKPTLDVVLAYVGACDGDVEAWRQRWHQLEAMLADSRTDQAVTSAADQPRREEESKPATSGDIVPPAPADTSDAAGRAATRAYRWRRLGVLAAAVVGVGAVGIVVLHRPHRAEPASAYACPKVTPHPAFTGVTYGAGARARSGASRDQPSSYTIPSNCTVGFTGYCLGQTVHDATGAVPDIRWFKLKDGNVVSSAVIHGNPPEDLRPSHCNHDRPGPEKITLSVGVDQARPGGLTLDASGANLDLVGFAASDGSAVDEASNRRWRQIGFTEATGSRFTAGLGSSQPGTATADGDVLVAAVACLGGNGPTAVIDVKAVRMGNPATPVQRSPLGQSEIVAAARSACQYPDRN
ncbi:MAG: Helix-turn-helix protein [Dactylosporangium sp.]|jgi:hypothetical protein|nr:Helix-turn-helix protein [Dactylosporangium sp.]